jgi:hypothetical protein
MTRPKATQPEGWPEETHRLSYPDGPKARKCEGKNRKGEPCGAFTGGPALCASHRRAR